jgi:hypothetical protein
MLPAVVGLLSLALVVFFVGMISARSSSARHARTGTSAVSTHSSEKSDPKRGNSMIVKEQVTDKVINQGWLEYKPNGHTLRDCISLVDDTGMGLVMWDFSKYQGKYVRLTVEEVAINDRES